MKNLIGIFLITILSLAVSYVHQNSNKTDVQNQKNNEKFVDNSLLDFYRQYSPYIDPGEYVYLYEKLPESLTELCSLIRSQFIHPYAELPRYHEQIPKERWNEIFRYPSEKSIMKGLVSYDSSGLTKERRREDRLVLGCMQNSILPISILKSGDISVRVRYGHATYLIPDFHTSHAICEVWNDNEKSWMLVYPNMDRLILARINLILVTIHDYNCKKGR